MKKKIIIIMHICIAVLMCVLIVSTCVQAKEKNHELAILVSNGDYPVETINLVASYNGFESYDDMVEHLVSVGELYHIPTFTYKDEYGEYTYEERYTCKGTVIYKDAVEMGVINP